LLKIFDIEKKQSGTDEKEGKKDIAAHYILSKKRNKGNGEKRRGKRKSRYLNPQAHSQQEVWGEK